MKPIFFIAFAALQSAVFAQSADFELTVSGVLAGKLAEDTQLRIWSPVTEQSDWKTISLADLPVSLPFKQFRGNAWNVEFESKRDGSHFSVFLSGDLFDEPRLITLKLDAPKPHILPIFWRERDVRYTANITQRMEYRELPQWDVERNCLTKPKTPVMRITSINDGTVIHDAQLVDGCMGSKWFALIDPDAKLDDGHTYRMTVNYDSGGLFQPITTTYDFTYQTTLHEK